MNPIKITVIATRAVCVDRPIPLTTGMVGLRAEFTFSSDWDGLTKTAVCVGSGITKDVLDVENEIVVPHECLTDPASDLKIGVYGVNSAGNLVIPTVYARVGRLFRGADPSGDTSADPTLPIWAQLQAMMGSLDNLTTTARDNLVAAINEAAKSGGAAADVRMQVADGYIQYSSDGGKSWNNLIAMKELIGPTDETLTESGQAADAKATGDVIRSLSEEIVTTSESKVSAHNTGEDSHNDIRLLISGLTDRLNALADSDDTTLDQLSEVVAYIKSNRTLIEAITTNKVSVTDIIDNLTTNVANKPLSAAQGVALKSLIDAISIPDKLPTPNALTFTGAVTGSYDGSAPLEVEIPSGGGGLTVTNTAAVGQTVKITAVDENGQPTEWEAVDFSSSGDAEKRVRHIATVAVTKGTTSYSVTVDSNGDALNLESVYILTEKFWGAGGSYVQVKINGKEITRAYGASGSPQAFAFEKMGELQKFTNIPKPSDVGISFGDYYNGKSAVTSVYFWASSSNVDTTIEIFGVDA